MRAACERDKECNSAKISNQLQNDNVKKLKFNYAAYVMSSALFLCCLECSTAVGRLGVAHIKGARLFLSLV